MTLSELRAHALELAESLEASIPLCTTRHEHIRVSGHANRARAISQALETIQEPQTGPPMVVPSLTP